MECRRRKIGFKKAVKEARKERAARRRLVSNVNPSQQSDLVKLWAKILGRWIYKEIHQIDRERFLEEIISRTVELPRGMVRQMGSSSHV